MTLTNWEIAVYALYLVGGVSRRVHTEDVACKCYELAPDAFSWIKYPRLPDKEVTRTGLMDARKAKYGALVIGRAGRGKGQSAKTSADPAADGWQLSDAGVEWIELNTDRLAAGLDQRAPRTGRQDLLRKLSRILSHDAYKQFLQQPEGFVPTIGQMASVFRCRVDADRGTWLKRLQTTRNLARMAGEETVREFVDACERALSQQLLST